MNRTTLGSLLAAAAFLAAPAAATAATYDDASASNTWNTVDLNWGGGLGWTNGDSAVFAGTGEAVTVGTVSAGSITFSSSGYVLSGGTITLTGSSITSTTNATLNSALAGSVGLTKAGASTLTLGGANTYTGTTNVNSGSLVFASGSSLSGGGAFNVGNAGVASMTISSGAGTVSSGGGDFNIGVSGGTGALTVSGGTLAIGNRLIIGDANTAGNTVTLGGGTITAAGGLVFGGGGRGSSTTGIFNLDGGILSLAYNSGFGGNVSRYGNAGTYTFNFNGGTIRNAASTAELLRFGAGSGSSEGGGTGIAYTIQAGGAFFDTVNGNASASANFAAASVNGGITKNGANTLTLTGVVTGNAANIVVNAGTLSLARSGLSYNNTGGFANGGTVLVKSGTTLTLAAAYNIGYAQAVTVDGGTLNLTSGNAGDGQNYTLNLTLANGATVSGNALRWGELGDATITVNGTTASTISSRLAMIAANNRAGTINVTDAGGVLNFNGVIANLTGSGTSLAKAGPGTLVMAGANTYTNTTTLAAGTLQLGVAEVAGTSGPLGASGTLVLSGGTLRHTASNTHDYSSRFSTAANQQYRVDTNGQSVTWATGLTSSGGSLTKSGNGTLTLSGASTFTGGITVSGGALSVGGTLGSGATYAGDIANGGSSALAFTGNANQTLSGVISGSAGLSKSGTGALTLSGANSYVGATSVSSGTLSVNGSLSASSAVTVASGATLAGSGTVSGSATVADGGSVTAGNGTSGSLSLGSLAFSGNGTINIGSLSNYTSTAAVAVAGNLGLSGTPGKLVTFNLAPGVLSNNTYHLLSHGGSLASLSGLAVTGATIGARQTASLVNNSGMVDYVVGGDSPYWTGANGSAFQGGDNWRLITGQGVTDYAEGDVLLFNDDATATTVAMAAAVTPTSVAFANETKSYQLQGSAGFSGGTFVKTGAGALAISNSNTFDAVTISGGTVSLGASQALGTGSVSLAGGALDVNGQSIANAIVLAGGDLRGSGTISGVLSGLGGFAKDDNGTLTLSATSTYTGGTTVSAGTLVLGHATDTLANGQAVTVSGGVLDLGANSDTVGALTLSGGSIAGSGTLTAASYSLQSGSASAGLAGSVGVTKSSAGTVTLSGANTYTGTTLVNAGTLSITGGGLAGGSEIRVGDATLTLSGSAGTVAVLNSNINIGHGTGVSGALNVDAGTLSASGTAGDLNLGVSGAASSTLVVDGGSINLASAGAGRLIIGDTNVGAHTATLSSGTITVRALVFGGGGADFFGSTTVGTFNLDGGALVVGDEGQGGVWRYAGYGTYAMNYNGGTLRNSKATGTLINTSKAITHTLQAGGLTLDISGGAATLNASFGGTGGLTKVGANTLTLGGASTFSGNSSIAAGRVTVTNQDAFGGSGTVTLNTAATGTANTSLYLDSLTLGRAITVADQGTGATTLGANGTAALPTFAGAITLAKDVTLDGGSNSDRLTFSGGIGGSGNVTIAGTGRVVFIDTANTFAGNLTVGASSILQLDYGTSTSRSYIPDAAVVTVNGTLNLAKGSNAETLAGLAGNGLVQGHPGVAGVASGIVIAGSGTHSFSGTLSDGGGASATLSLTKSGSGTQTLASANTYSGGTTITAGTLVIGDVASLGTGSVLLSGGYLDLANLAPTNVIVVSGGSLLNAATWASQGPIQLSGSLDSSVINNLGADITEVKVASGATVNLSGVTKDIVFEGGSLNGLGSFNGKIKVKGELDVSGGTHGGELEVASGGTLNFGNASSSRTVKFTGGAISGSNFTGNVEVVGSNISLTSSIGAGKVLLTSGNSASIQSGFSRDITYEGGTLSGLDNYSGALTVQGNSTLDLDGTSNTAVTTGAAITVASGSTLSGSGTISGAASISGTHSVGNSPGTQSFGNGLSYGSAAVVAWEFTAAVDAYFDDNDVVGGRGTDYDAINLTGGNLTIASGATLQVNDPIAVDYTGAFWDSVRNFLVIDVAYGSSITGAFNLSHTRAASVSGEGAWSIAQAFSGDEGIYLRWTPVPEPSTYGLMLGGLALAGAAIRRRRKKKD